MYLRLLLRSICLRRTKDFINLAEPEEVVHEIQLSAKEIALYRDIEHQARTLIDEVICGSESLKTYSVILQAITRLRRACSHGTMDQELQAQLRTEAKAFILNEEGIMDSIDPVDGNYCAQCSSDIKVISELPGRETGRFTPCKCLLCSDCYVEWEEKSTSRTSPKKTYCTVCRASISKSVAHTRKQSQNAVNPTGVASKISRLVEDLRQYHNCEKRYVAIRWFFRSKYAVDA